MEIKKKNVQNMISNKSRKFDPVRQNLLTRPDQGCLPFYWQWAPLVQCYKNKGELLATQSNDCRAIGLPTTLDGPIMWALK
jgi:gentisate 1,2-dioxygenase